MVAGRELLAQRRAKREHWRESGHESYPLVYPGRETTARVYEEAGKLAPGVTDDKTTRRVAGRVLLLRKVGKNAFLPLRDATGDIQLHLQSDVMGSDLYDRVLSTLDGGDIIGAEGNPSKTSRGEPSLLVRSVTLLAKALNPMPEKWHGLKDPEARLRQRYVDLFTSTDSFRTFVARSRLVRELRMELDRRGFYEVETPVLGRVASGATAKPFETHYNFLDEDYRLRISLELHLKRLLVGGFEKVYEIGKVFRNEDLDSTHSPEFTMLELYWAYADYEDIRALVEGVFSHLAGMASKMVPPAQGEQLVRSFTPPFRRLDFVESLEKESGIHDPLSLSVDQLRTLAKEAGARINSETSPGTCMDKLFSRYVEPTLQEPTFVFDHPLSTTPLARRHRSKPGRVERFELYYHGLEMANAYSELNEPDEQEARFREQVREETEDSYAFDEDFVEALRYGMPPAGGLGFGVDRLIMVLLGAPSIKDVILFPPTRPKIEGSPQ
jgi:lysyl-tRNA synthetase class 2